MHTTRFSNIKLIAWDDRPEVRREDIIDISDILRHFFNIHFNIHDKVIWEEHNDLFIDEDDNLPQIVARVIGREMSRIIRRNERIFNRIKTILIGEEGNNVNSSIAAIMVNYFNNNQEENMQLQNAIKLGFLE